MRKLGIVVAIAAAALYTLGFSGVASAQEQLKPACDVFQQIHDQAAPNDPSGGGGEPVASSAQGLADSCNNSIDDQKVEPSPALCGVAKGLDAVPGEQLGTDIGSQTVGAVNDGLADNVPDNPLIGLDKCAQAPDGNGGPTTNPPSQGSPNQQPQVLAQNATADGSMPRTGVNGELFAGAGLGLLGLAAFGRRFLAQAA